MDDAPQRRDDFVVRIGEGPDGLTVQVTESPEGQSPAAPFRDPFSGEELRRLERRFSVAGGASGRQEAGRRRNLRPLEAPDDAGWAERVGERLFEALLPEPLREHWRRSLWEVDRDEDPRRRLLLRVRFGLAGTEGGTGAGVESLQCLPWELLRDPERGEFLVFDDRCSVARYLEVPRPSPRRPSPRPLVVLAVGASPRGGATPHLELRAEVEHLEAELGDGVDLRPLPNATLEDLRQELRRGTVHVLHFMGHGDFDRATGEGSLMLEDGAGSPVPVGSRELLKAVGSALQGTRLVVLNACRTAETAASTPWGGLATALVGHGVGAVVAMTHPITDRAALAFSRGFYAHLADSGGIDAAVHEGRRAILSECPGSAEWAIPALFLRSSDGPLVDPEPRVRRRGARAVAVALSALVGSGVLGLWLAAGGLPGVTGGPADRDAARHDGSPVAAPAVHELRSGETVDLPEISATVTVELVEVAGQEMVRLTVSPDRGDLVRQAVFPGDTLTVPAADGEITVQVLEADFAARTVTIRASAS